VGQGSRSRILLCGGFRLPDGSASAQRAIPNVRILQSLGYEVHLVGKAHLPSLGLEKPPHRFEVEGISCWNIQSPIEGAKLGRYEQTSDVIEAVVKELGVSTLHSVITYNYPMGGVATMNRFCRSNGIIPIVDTTEWYGLNGWRPLEVLRFLNHEKRMRITQKQVGNMICGSSYLARYYEKFNTVIVPNCVDMDAPKWQTPPAARPQSGRRFIFVGSAGARMKKDNVAALVEAFAKLPSDAPDHVFHVLGITADQMVQVEPELSTAIQRMGSRLVCHGRVPHIQALSEIKASDFFVFFRPRTRANEAGCPTKLAEAFSCGIPTITNDSGDVSRYITSPLHGMVVPKPDVDDMADALTKALAIPDGQLNKMKEACFKDNPFRYQIYASQVGDFLAKAEKGIRP